MGKTICLGRLGPIAHVVAAEEFYGLVRPVLVRTVMHIPAHGMPVLVEEFVELLGYDMSVQCEKASRPPCRREALRSTSSCLCKEPSGAFLSLPSCSTALA